MYTSSGVKCSNLIGFQQPLFIALKSDLINDLKYFVSLK